MSAAAVRSVSADAVLGRSAGRLDEGRVGRLWLPELTPVQSALIEAVAYGDVFDHPLTMAEIHRQLPIRASLRDVEFALAEPGLADFVHVVDGLVMLAGRESLPAVRRRRAAASRRLWPQAIRLGRLVGTLPFVRMVAITGSLAVDAAESDADVDLFLVTDTGRLWLSRALTMGVVRAAAVGGLRLCPNYLVADSALELDDRSLYTAHELLQMVPVVGLSVHAELVRRNRWSAAFLPNSRGQAARGATSPGLPDRIVRQLLERPLRSSLGDRLERWEMTRKIARLSALSRSIELRYDAACCKGHADEHGRRILAAFDDRVARLNGRR